MERASHSRLVHATECAETQRQLGVAAYQCLTKPDEFTNLPRTNCQDGKTPVATELTCCRRRAQTISPSCSKNSNRLPRDDKKQKSDPCTQPDINV
eukprot:15452314-Alexandrium_andersonii.AAC.1